MAAVAFAVLYCIGVIVSTMHLSRLGVLSFSVLRLQHLTAGFWATVPICCAAASAYLTAMLLTRQDSRLLDRHWITVTVALLASMLSGVVFLGAAFSVLLKSSALAYTIMSQHLFLDYVPLFFAQFLLIADATFLSPLECKYESMRHTVALLEISRQQLLARHDKSQETINDQSKAELTETDKLQDWLKERLKDPLIPIARDLRRPLLTAFILLSLGAFLRLFAANSYERIPMTLGGGGAIPVQLLFQEKHLSSFSGLVMDSTGLRSIPYNLLAETDQQYILKSADSLVSSLAINKNAVSGIITLRTNKR